MVNWPLGLLPEKTGKRKNSDFKHFQRIKNLFHFSVFHEIQRPQLRCIPPMSAAFRIAIGEETGDGKHVVTVFPEPVQK